ncbi:putative aldo/keto reductase-like oxidoreductase [Ruminiclostridium sufflavum DSM 19573]|uniref:Putative aldo/keto reductase-like oxidoreductase n=1 Tax=Ruminiclostridium sufflavum DSM 19573 TaxID=1121337 RepID=A0A318XI76_9FIRM|nr:aldo/keto reductase [Ruminiclostridium sufflavum]PYG85621.1 putative aldo/keto reductase-like oxidoreductase [Ruminiclostridium sufflavum DSM 19573]
MSQVILGKTGISANKNGFGALPIQRIGREAARELLRKAYDSGINFFDTARFYTDSEEKIGYALGDVREKIYIASKTMTVNVKDFWEQLNTSLSFLKTDYLDIYQFHNPAFCPKSGDGTGLYEAMLEAKDKGMIRHIGITNHRIKIAADAAESGLYETIQYPFSYLATDEETELVIKCRKYGIGFIAMKALSGGLISNSAAAYAYLAQYDNVLPIWGIQREKELEEFAGYIDNPPVLNRELSAAIEQDKKELGAEFCRGCGYCLPCPANIDIPTSARMSLMIKRAPASIYLNKEWQGKMKRIDDCINCGHCKSHCPYGLDTPELLRKNWRDYKTFI